MPAQATGLAALLQKMMPGLSAGADKLFMPGGVLGMGQPQAMTGQVDPNMAPATGPMDMAQMSGAQGGSPADAMQQQPGLASLTQNPAFGLGMGILQGNQRGDPFGGAMRGLQGANQAAIEAADRERQEGLRQAMADYFESRARGGEAVPAELGSRDVKAADYGTAVGDLANQQRINALLQGGQGIDPMLRMMLESGQPGAINGYGGLNPFLLGAMG